ncbi:MAG: cation efflux protein, CzcI family [Roseateles sp.]|uniref:Cobalt-zinc-cadmium resistance protein n=1 Tax=Roseateles asaccharophilus TaxID=582607 RepID=A0ABU2AG39_9BURK|nr:cation efflux protein, CzcI family [Roseateles asaccharophilus]MDR7336188.1 hypothetical protein [Roseateles asaccharophilus]
MRRWLTILLLFVLPVQFAWSAAAAYCQHEEVAGIAHFGHHAHDHAASSHGGGKLSGAGEKSSDQSPAKGMKLVGDNDCSFCHLSFAKPMVPVAFQFDKSSVSQPDSASEQAFRSRGPDLLERPNWRVA